MALDAIFFLVRACGPFNRSPVNEASSGERFAVGQFLEEGRRVRLCSVFSRIYVKSFVRSGTRRRTMSSGVRLAVGFESGTEIVLCNFVRRRDRDERLAVLAGTSCSDQ